MGQLPKNLIVDYLEGKLMACDELGGPGDYLAATSENFVPQNCFCFDSPNLCPDVVPGCPDFVSIPPIVLTGLLAGCPFNSTITFDLPLVNIATLQGGIGVSYISQWRTDQGGPGGVIGHWTISASGQCAGGDAFNFSSDIYASSSDANDSGNCNINSLWDCATGGCTLVCTTLAGGVKGWEFHVSTSAGLFSTTKMCPRYRTVTGFNAECATNSMTFTIYPFWPTGGICGAGSHSVQYDNGLTVSGFNFFN